MKNTCTLVNAAVAAALLVAGSRITPAQTSPWQTLYEGPGQVYSALIDPFSTPPQATNLFFGGPQLYSGWSVQWVGPLGDPLTPPTAVGKDNDPASSTDLGVDSSGNLYSVGYGSLGWQVRESADQGTSWTTIEVPFPTVSSAALGFAADDAANVFVCGYANGQWLVRKRHGNGNFSPFADWSQRGQSYIARKMHLTAGYLFVVGEATDKWGVQRFNFAKSSWDLSYTGSPKGMKAGAWAVTSNGNNIYVLAWADGISEAPKQCVLLMGANLGTGPWTILKTFTESPNINRPADLGFDLNGNLFVAGDSTFYDTTYNSWHPASIVRRYDASSGAWQSWLPLGNPPPADQVSFGRKVSVDPAGTVFITSERRYRVGPNDYSDRRAVVQEWP
jgi:hypothetical protein